MRLYKEQTEDGALTHFEGRTQGGEFTACGMAFDGPADDRDSQLGLEIIFGTAKDCNCQECISTVVFYKKIRLTKDQTEGAQ